jgi:DNA-directed RNA polymerase specialized sigma24 family protein
MQPPTNATSSSPLGDEDALYRAHHRELHRAVAHAVRAPRELIEDACQSAWAMLLRTQPDRYAIFGWLRVVAIHEAYRLSAIDRRDARLERLRREDGDWHDVIADPRSLDDAVEALEALRALAQLPARQRQDLSMNVAGYSYEEIRTITGDRTFTNVNKSLVKARRRIRQARAVSGALG